MVHGSCLCGGVRFEADAVEILTICHCSMCRKAHGAAYGVYGNAYRSGFRWLAGEDSIQDYASSETNTRCFCRVCGSNVPHDDGESETVAIPAGVLDDDPGVRPVLQMFTGSKAPWVDLDASMPAFETWVPGYGPSDEENR